MLFWKLIGLLMKVMAKVGYDRNSSVDGSRRESATARMTPAARALINSGRPLHNHYDALGRYSARYCIANDCNARDLAQHDLLLGGG